MEKKTNEHKSLSQIPAICNHHSEHHQRQGDSSRDRLDLVDCPTQLICIICSYLLIWKAQQPRKTRPVVLLGPTWRLMGLNLISMKQDYLIMITVQSYHKRPLLKDNISLTKVLWGSEHPVNKLIIQLISSSKKKSTLPLGQIQKGDNLKPANSLHVAHCEWEALSCISVSETYVGIKDFLVLPTKYIFGWQYIR